MEYFILVLIDKLFSCSSDSAGEALVAVLLVVPSDVEVVEEVGMDADQVEVIAVALCSCTVDHGFTIAAGPVGIVTASLSRGEEARRRVIWVFV
ncbi:unnamed protein product [Protopolystoma xenopodis]|uniref:Uncharacterized protein n=1 Tax=Protopolystoma xenopodis TaxID=117903 RepID=A0A448WCF0_9PLAT|nr:unnamed protein product [Protopolystoma xenopodis]